MNKLFAAVPVVILVGASFVASCGTSDQGTGTGSGHGGSGGAATGSGGTGGSSTGQGGSTATGGSGGTGPSANGGSGGATVDAGSDAPTATGGAGGAGGGAGGAGGLLAVAMPLNGAMLLGPCRADTSPAVCTTGNGACPGANTANSGLAGVLTTDKTITLGGTAGQMYTISLHVQGEVEAKAYNNTMDVEGTLQSPRANGFATGGTPTTGDAYNVYVLRVTNPGSTAVTNYYLNSLVGPGVSNHTTYGIDYMANIKAQGGATIRMIAADSNCSMIKNCGPTANNGSVCAAPIIMQNIEPQAVTLNPTFSFTTVYNGQWIVITVMNVTSP